MLVPSPSLEKGFPENGIKESKVEPGRFGDGVESPDVSEPPDAAVPKPVPGLPVTGDVTGAKRALINTPHPSPCLLYLA